MKRPKRNENQMPERMNIWCSYEENITEYWEENGEKCEDEYTNSGVHELFLNNKKDYLIMKSLWKARTEHLNFVSQIRKQ